MSVFATQCPLHRVGMSLVPKFDLSPASDVGAALRRTYGPLHWVLEPNVAPWTPNVMDMIRDGLQDYRESDFILLMGNPVLMGMHSLLAGDMFNSITFLQWGNGTYRPITVQL